MKRFVPNYTCKKTEQTGITCLQALMDYAGKVGIYENKINDMSESAKKISKELTASSPWKTLIIYDLAALALSKNYCARIIKEKDSHPSDNKNINDYSRKEREELLKKGLKEEIIVEIEKALIKELEKNPVMAFMNLNYLYKQNNAGMGWIIITEYNPKMDEFIIYDPMYYTRLPKTAYWERMKNTPKKRFITFKNNYFLKNWRLTGETKVFFKGDAERTGFMPFIREFLSISAANT